MRKSLIPRGLLISIFAIFAGCSSSNTVSDPQPDPPAVVVDPLLSLYGDWLTDCVDFGGGLKNQIFANLDSDGNINLAVLSWANDGCSGPYTLSDFNGNPQTGPKKLNTFELLDVADVPENFFVLKITAVSDDSVTYGIFYVLDDKFSIFSDLETAHDTWAEWLTEPDVSDFVADPENSSSMINTVIHFNSSEFPDPLDPLYAHWLSDCIDLGGGNVNQIYAEFSTGQPKTAVLTWDTGGCSGIYTLSDLAGSPITEPTHVQDLEYIAVLGSPMGVYVPKVTNLSDDSVVYPVIQIEPTMGNEFYELVPFSSTHDAWTDWLLEPEVSGFIGDPVGYSPMTHLKFHFTKSELP